MGFGWMRLAVGGSGDWSGEWGIPTQTELQSSGLDGPGKEEQRGLILVQKGPVNWTGWAREGEAEGGKGLVGGGGQASRASGGRWLLVTDTDSYLFRTCIQWFRVY